MNYSKYLHANMFLFVIAIALLGAGSHLSAAIVPCPASASIAALEAFDTAGDACYSQDKLFFGFNYTPTGSDPAASAITATLIFQQVPSIDIHGWNFGGPGWSDAFTLGYTIEVCSASPCSAVPGTVIKNADAVYAPIAVGPPAGNEVVTWSGGATATATLTQGSPGPLPPGGNIGLGSAGTLGPITVSAAFAGGGTVTQTTLRFYEGVPAPVPEGSTFALGLCGFALISVARFYRWRRRSDLS